MTNYLEETVVCFHGWLDNANSFAPLAPLLATKFNMRVIGIDLPGHGMGSHSLLGYYSYTLYTATMIRILHRLHLRSFHLIGHSLSAVFLPYLLPILENSGKFSIKSLICIEQFGAMRNQIDMKSVRLDSLLPPKEVENEEDIKTLPKLYNSVDELVRSRIYVTESIYPGTQTIGEQSARLILERNVGKLMVIESHTRKKQIKYYLRFDPKLKIGSNAFRNMFVYDLQRMSTHVIQKSKCEILAVFADDGWPHLDAIAKNIDRLKMCNLNVLRMKGSHHLHADNPQTFLNAITPFITRAIEKYKEQQNGNLNAFENGHSKL